MIPTCSRCGAKDAIVLMIDDMQLCDHCTMRTNNAQRDIALVVARILPFHPRRRVTRRDGLRALIEQDRRR